MDVVNDALITITEMCFTISIFCDTKQDFFKQISYAKQKNAVQFTLD